MEFIRRILLQGNSACVTLPRNAMHYLKWRPGDHVVITLTAERTLVFEKWRKYPEKPEEPPIPAEVLNPPVPS